MQGRQDCAIAKGWQRIAGRCQQTNSGWFTFQQSCSLLCCDKEGPAVLPTSPFSVTPRCVFTGWQLPAAATGSSCYRVVSLPHPHLFNGSILVA